MHALSFAAGNPTPARTPSPSPPPPLASRMQLKLMIHARWRSVRWTRLFVGTKTLSSGSGICINCLLADRDHAKHAPHPPHPPLQNQIRFDSEGIIKLNFCCSQQLSKTL